MKRIAILLIVALFATSLVVAQSFTKSKVPGAQVFTLIVRTNPLTATIFIDGEQAGGTIFQVPAGPHTILVRAPGFQDFSTQITLNQNMTLPVTLQPAANAQLVVNANVNGALVILNGNQVGTTPFSGQLNPGTYALVVRATGYQDWTTQLVMSGPQTLNVTLHPLNYQLVVNANVNGALVFLNGNQVGTTPFSGQLVPGTYSLLVRAPGYQDWMTQVPLSGPRTLTVTLQPMNYQLVVNANVNGALVFLNNNQVGTTPFSGQLTPGTYALLVRAPGYQDWTTQVAMSGPQTLAVVLQPLNYQLSVNANVPGALVYLNDNQAGTTPFVAQIAPGSYSIVVTAPGYQDWTTQVTMNGPQTLNASLQPTMASLVFDLKPDNFTREMRDKRFAQVQVFVDNVQQKGFTLQVAPGPHQIRVVSWGMQSVITLTCEAGKSYTITPALSLAVQQ